MRHYLANNAGIFENFNLNYPIYSRYVIIQKSLFKGGKSIVIK